MKTIAISIEEDAIRALNAVTAKKSPGRRSRSEVIRLALREYLQRESRKAREADEALVSNRHRERLAKEAEALVAEQAKL